MYGVLSPVILDEDGHILDGHHRVQAATELGVTYPITVLPGLTHEQKLEQALLLNMARRHLTVEQCRQLVADLRGRGLSVRFISDSTGIPRSTVHRDAAGVPGGTPGYVTGKDGKRYSPERTYDPVAVWRAQWRAQGILCDRLPADGAQLQGTLLRRLPGMFPDLNDAPADFWDERARLKLLEVAAAHMIRTGTLLPHPDHWPADCRGRPGPHSEANFAAKWKLRVVAAAGEFFTWCDDVGITRRWGKQPGFVLPEDLELEHLWHFVCFMLAPPTEANDAFLDSLSPLSRERWGNEAPA